MKTNTNLEYMFTIMNNRDTIYKQNEDINLNNKRLATWFPLKVQKNILFLKNLLAIIQFRIKTIQVCSDKDVYVAKVTELEQLHADYVLQLTNHQAEFEQLKKTYKVKFVDVPKITMS